MALHLKSLRSRLFEHEFTVNRSHSQVEQSELAGLAATPGTQCCQAEARQLMALIGFSVISQLMWVYIFLRGKSVFSDMDPLM